MRGIATLLLLVALASLLFAGCFRPAPAYVADWEEEAAGHGEMGVKANLSLTADDHVTVGAGELQQVEAPFRVAPGQHSSRGGPFLFFHGTVLDVGSGLIVVEDDEVEITDGTIQTLPVDRIGGGDGAVTARMRADGPGGKPDVTFSEDLHALRSAYFFADSAQVQARDLVIERADRALIIMNGNATELPFPFRFDAEHIAADHSSAFHFEEAAATFPTFGYAGSTGSGSIVLDGHPNVAQPTAVFGRDATLHFTPTKVTSVGTFRLTQASTADGYALEAAVELRAQREVVEVVAGNTTWAQVRYRESGYLGAAIVQNVTVTGRAAELVRVPLEAPPWIVETLWQEVDAAGIPGLLFMAPWLLIASPFLIIGEAIFKAFDCLLTDCPGEHPYPSWMEPGEIGRFYYQVDASGVAPGTYEGTIVFDGANHDAVHLPVRIEVGPDAGSK